MFLVRCQSSAVGSTMMGLGFRVVIHIIWLQSAAITVAVMMAKCSRMTSTITTANRNAAVIRVHWRHYHEFVIIAPVFKKYIA